MTSDDYAGLKLHDWSLNHQPSPDPLNLIRSRHEKMAEPVNLVWGQIVGTLYQSNESFLDVKTKVIKGWSIYYVRLLFVWNILFQIK